MPRRASRGASGLCAEEPDPRRFTLTLSVTADTVIDLLAALDAAHRAVTRGKRRATLRGEAAGTLEVVNSGDLDRDSYFARMAEALGGGLLERGLA